MVHWLSAFPHKDLNERSGTYKCSIPTNWMVQGVLSEHILLIRTQLLAFIIIPVTGNGILFGFWFPFQHGIWGLLFKYKLCHPCEGLGAKNGHTKQGRKSCHTSRSKPMGGRAMRWKMRSIIYKELKNGYKHRENAFAVAMGVLFCAQVTSCFWWIFNVTHSASAVMYRTILFLSQKYS